jgi:hypothetical protein
MASIDLTRSYNNGEPLLEADLDAIQTDVKTFLNVTKINDDNLQTNSIDAETKIVSSSITTAKIAVGSITTDKIASSAITTAKLNDASVDDAALNALSITTALIATGAVTGAKITAANVTAAKRESVGQQLSSLVNFSTTSGSEVDVTAATASITTTGKPVMIWLQKSTTTAGAGLSIPVVSADIIYKIYRDASVVATFNLRHYYNGSTASYGTTGQLINNGLNTIEFPAAGTYTYKLTAQSSGGLATAIENSYLAVMELF